MEEAGSSLLKIVPVEADVVVVDSWPEKWYFPPKSSILTLIQGKLCL